MSKIKLPNPLQLDDYDERQRKVITGGLLLGIAAALTVAGSTIGIIAGVRVARPNIAYVQAQILNTQVHAGEALILKEAVSMPKDCIPTTMRYIGFPYENALKAMDQHREVTADVFNSTSLIPNEPMPDGPPAHIPVPISTEQGCGAFIEKRSPIGCGPLNGLLEPVPDQTLPIKVCVLAPRVVFAKVSP